jgi:hypothetical protein
VQCRFDAFRRRLRFARSRHVGNRATSCKAKRYCVKAPRLKTKKRVAREEIIQNQSGKNLFFEEIYFNNI